MYKKIQAIVLREVEYKDADKLLTVLSRDDGRLTLRARGVRRSRSPLKSACQLLAYSEFTVFEYREFCTVNEAVPLELFQELRRDLDLLALASYFAQVAEVLSQEDAPNEELLSLLLNCIYALCRLDRPNGQIKAVFELRAACLAGYAPDLSACRICGNVEPDRFLLQDGCLECAGCSTGDGIHMPVSPGVLAALRYLVECPAGRLFSFRLPEAALRQLSELTEAFLATQLERGFSALDFYKSLQLV